MNRFQYWPVIFCCLYSTFLWATDQFNLQPVKVQTAKDGLLHWVRSEAYRDHHPLFGREKILPQTRFHNPQVINAFPDDLYFEDTADASLMVLFYAPGWQSTDKSPILLIHGAGDNAFRAWVHPLSHSTTENIPPTEIGFMQRLVQQGYPVFAINFSHSHGCNYRQAEQIHNAIEVIKNKTATNRVHIIAHSKGNCAASLYLADGGMVNENYRDFISPYGQDIGVYVQIGAGNKGNDLIFRFYMGNLQVVSENLSSPLCFYSALTYGTWNNFYREDIYKRNPGKAYGNYYPGQCQLLYNLVADGLDFSWYSYTPADFNATMNACYYGGTTLYVAGYGIEHAIAKVEYTISRINHRGVVPAVKLVNIYGTNPKIKEIDLGFIKIPIGASDYPGDGLIYVHSAGYIDGLISRGAHLLGQKGFAKNHLRIAYDPEVLAWLSRFLE